MQADGQPQLLGPLLVRGLLHLEHVCTVALPALDDVHVRAARIVRLHALLRGRGCAKENGGKKV